MTLKRHQFTDAYLWHIYAKEKWKQVKEPCKSKPPLRSKICIMSNYTTERHIILEDQAPVVQMLDSAIHWINHYPLVNSIGFASVYPLDSDLSGGQRYPSFEQWGQKYRDFVFRFNQSKVSLW